MRAQAWARAPGYSGAPSEVPLSMSCASPSLSEETDGPQERCSCADRRGAC